MAHWWTRFNCARRNDARIGKCSLAARWVYVCHKTFEADDSFSCAPGDAWFAAQCGASVAQYRKLRGELIAAGLLSQAGRVVDYDETQAKDKALNDRVARHRQRASVSRNATRGVTGNVTGNAPIVENNTETEEGDSSSSVDESTRAAAGGAAPESPPGVADAPPETRRDAVASHRQQVMAASYLRQHGLTVAGWLADKGEPELMVSHVDEIVARYRGRQPPPATGPRGHLLPEAPDPDLSDEDRAASAAALAAAKANGRRSTGKVGRGQIRA